MSFIHILEDCEFNSQKPIMKVLLDTEFSKEIRICMAKDTEMSEHSSPKPIAVQVIEGKIIFGVNGVEHTMVAGTFVTFEGNIQHHLKALEDSILRLTIFKG